MRIAEAPDRLVRNPSTGQRLPGADSEGLEVADTDVHWARALEEGDVIRIQTQPAPPAATPASRKGKA